MKKRVLCVVLVFTMICALVPCVASAYSGTKYGDYLYYRINSDNTVTITDCGVSAVSIDIPAFIDGMSVTSIGDFAFEQRSGLTSITIPDSVTSIGTSAFEWCCSLTSITIPDSVTSIGTSAFKSCVSLTNVTIPDSVTSIGYDTFSDCRNLTNVTIPDSVTSIGTSAFEWCDSLTNVIIPDSVTSIGDSAFQSCHSLTSVIIPDSVTSIGDHAFSVCESLTNVTIPDSVTSIGYGTFYYCRNLTNVTIPDSVTSIGTYAFSYCNITSVTIPDSVTSIGDSAFMYCDDLTDVYYSGNETDWQKVSIGSRNSDLTNATIHYNSFGPPSGTFGTTNSTSVGAPIINSVTLADSNTNYNIMDINVNIQEDSTLSATLNVDVDWNGGANGKIYITQGVKTSIEVPDGTLTFNPGEELSAGKAVYILAIDEETGKTTSTKVKLKINAKNGAQWNPESGTNKFNFKLGKDIGFTIPDSVVFPFGGMEIGFGLDFIPITFEYESENKINIAFGLDSSNVDETTGRFKGFSFADYKAELKSNMKKGVNGYQAAKSNDKLVKELKNKFPEMKFDKVKFNVSKGIEMNTEISGYAEMNYVDGSWCFSEGFLALNAEVSYEYQGQVFIWVVPCYYEFGGKIGGGIEGTLKNIDFNGFKPDLEGYISAKVGASIGGGVGVANVCTLGASGEGSLNFKTALHKSYLKAWGEGDADFKVKVLGKTVAKKNFAHGEFTIYETGNKNALIKDPSGIELSSLNDVYESINIYDVYPNESRAYAENAALWLGDVPQASLASADYTNKDLKLLAENIYTESAPQICEIDGKKVMVTQWDNTARADADRTMLVYSVYDEASETWSAPVPVDDDGTADFYPCFNDGYLVWQNEKTTLSDDMTLADIAKLGEICAAKWNGNGFDAPVKITDNDSLDTQPQVASNGSGASVVWTTNTENDIIGITGKNAVMQADFDGVNWGVPAEVKAELNAVANIAAGNVNGEFCIAYVVDDDNDLNTINDRDIRIIRNGAETQLTDNDVLDSNPVFANNMIYYYSEGNIVYADIDGADKQTVFAEAMPGLTDSFTVDSNGSGDTAIWWTKAVDGGSEVYSSLYKDNEWSGGIQVTSVGNKAKYPSGIINDDGSMVVAFNNGILENNEVVKTDLYTISVNPSYDLELTDAYFDEDSMTAYAVIKNNGELAINSYTVTLADDQKQVTEPLKAGESAEIEIAYTKPQNLTKREIELSAAIADGEEYNTENNSAVFTIGNADIAVENAAVDEEETTVTADVSNIGYDSAQNVKIQLRDGSADGSVIEEMTVNLAAGENESIAFTIDKSAMRFYDAAKQLYVTAGGDFDEVSLGNNDGYVLINSPSGAADYETEILSYKEIDGKYVINSIARNNTMESISCIMYSAVYSSEGTFKAGGTVRANIDADNDTGVDIAVPCAVETGDVIKTFMWTDEMEPLAKTGEAAIV